MELERRADGAAPRPTGVAREVDPGATEARLRASEAQARLAVKVAQLGTWQYDPADDLVHLDERMRIIWGEPPEAAALPLPQVMARIHPEDRERVARAVEAALGPASPDGAYDVDYRIVWPSGEERWVAAAGQAFFEGAGAARRPVGFFGTALDITERKRAESALREREARLEAELHDARLLQGISTQLMHERDVEALFEKLLDAAVAIMRSDFASLQLVDTERGDRGELRLLAFRGFTPRAATFWDWVHLESSCACGRSLRDGRRVIVPDVEACNVLAGTADLAAYRETGIRAVQTTPLVSRGGRILGMLSTHWREPHRPSERALSLLDVLARQAADLIEHRQAEDALRAAKETAERASQAKSHFLSTMSHELRTPLTAVIGLSDLIGTEIVGPMNEKQKEYLSRINASAWHLVTIIDDILTFSRSEAGREEVRLADADVAAIAREVVAMFGGEAQARSLALGLHGAEEPLVLRTDAGKVRQIVTNLIGNALKYTETGDVDVDLDRADGRLELCVRDTGPGIPADLLEEIFEPFTQVDQSSTRSQGGTGLGLTICRKLARLLGGDVAVETTVGAGSTFTLSLPRRIAGEEAHG